MNELFKFCGQATPVCFNMQQHMAVILITNLAKEEDITKQRNPLTNEMFIKICRAGSIRTASDNIKFFMKVTILALIISPRSNEMFQKTQSKADDYKYPSEKEVTMVHTRKDYEFFDKKRKTYYKI